MSWRALFSTSSGLEQVERQLVEMLRLDQRSFELAIQALEAVDDVEELRRVVSDTDHQVNLLVQEVRRQLLVHASVRESLADIPAIFTHMSIVKDIERIGDHAKNILAIAHARARGGQHAPPSSTGTATQDRSVTCAHRSSTWSSNTTPPAPGSCSSRPLLC